MLNVFNLSASSYPSAANRYDYPGSFDALRRQARSCPCERHRNFFDQNQAEIQRRCEGRDPNGWRMEGRQRYDKGRPAQTQIAQQSDTGTTILAGNNKVTINKADASMLVQNADGTQQNYSLKEWGDPHVDFNGKPLGLIGNDMGVTLSDGTEIRLLMGNGNGGAPVEGQAHYLDTVAIRSPDGTGALVTGVSGPGKLGVTPLDSSYSKEFMVDEALNRFGTYAPSWVNINRNGQLIDSSNGQVVHDQYGLDRLDQQQRLNEAARNLYNQGYTPMGLAGQYDRPYGQYTPQMRADSEARMAQQLGWLQHLQARTQDGLGELRMLLARHSLAESQGWRGWRVNN